MILLFLSDNKLYTIDANKNVSSVESKFANDSIQKAIEIEKKKEWKTTGTGAKFMGVSPWSEEGTNPSLYNISMRGMCSTKDSGKILYTLEGNNFGGLFSYDLKEKREQRLIHGADFSAKDLNMNQTTGEVICSVGYPNGSANLSLIHNELTAIQEITEGDSIDEMPSWIPGEQKKVVYQSAGIGRNKEGMFWGLSPSVIEMLDMDTGTIETILQDKKKDFLLPRRNLQGDLFCIRRPWEDASRGASPFVVLKDILFFPFRLLRALFHYLNFFSLMYSHKGLTSERAGGAKVQGPDMKTVMIKGRMIDLQKQQAKAKKNAPTGSIVPNDWELVKVSSGGEISVLAKGVVSFDLSENGEIVYTNGREIFLLEEQGKKKNWDRHSLIEDIAIVEN
ncbi:MAG: hypothetical protein AAF518_09825 [Spirochaetota bacterium]